MNLKLTYGIIFGILGFVIGCFLVLLFLIGVGFLVNLVLGQDAFSSLVGLPLQIILGIGFLGLIGFEVYSINKGLAFGAAREAEEDRKVLVQTAQVYLLASLIALGICAQFTVSLIRSTNDRITEANPNLQQERILSENQAILQELAPLLLPPPEQIQ